MRTSSIVAVVRLGTDVSSIVPSRLYPTRDRQENQALMEFLYRYARIGFHWGVSDCLLWLGDWIQECRGVDPAAAWRGTYRVAFGAARIVYRAGGLVPLVAGAVEPLGFTRTAEPKRGDIAIAQTEQGERGVIVLGGNVACLSDHGIVAQRLPIVASWSV